MRRAVALAALVLLAGTDTAQAKADDSKANCKHEGFVSYVDSATGQPFVDQGTCVSSVANGGELVPVAPPVTLTVTEEPDGTIGDYRLVIRMAGLQPETQFSMSTVTRDNRAYTYTDFVAYADGTYRWSLDQDCRDEAVLAGNVVIVQGDVTVSTPVPEITECPAEG